MKSLRLLIDYFIQNCQTINLIVTYVNFEVQDQYKYIHVITSIENNLNFLRKNIGIAFNFAFYNLFVDYSWQEYNSINLGVSLGVR